MEEGSLTPVKTKMDTVLIKPIIPGTLSTVLLCGIELHPHHLESTSPTDQFSGTKESNPPDEEVPFCLSLRPGLQPWSILVGGYMSPENIDFLIAGY